MIRLENIRTGARMLGPIWRYIRPYRWTVVFALSLGGLMSVGALYFSHLVGTIQDHILVNKDIEKLFVLVASFLAVFLFTLTLRYFHRTILRGCAERASLTLRNEMFDKILRMDLLHVYQRSGGDILSRFLNDAKVFHIGIEISSELIRDGLFVIVLLGYAFFLNWQFMTVAILAMPLIAYVFYRVGTSTRRNTLKSVELFSKMTRQYEQAYSGIREIHIYHRERHVMNMFDFENQSYLRRWMRVVRMEELGAPLIEGIGAFIGGALLWFGGLAIIHGSMSPGAFISFLVALALTQHPIRNLNRVNAKLAQATAAAERIMEFLNIRGSIESDQMPAGTARARVLEHPAQIELQNLTFSYVPKHPVLHNINMTFQMGRKHALVGPSGGGKSTLYNLIVRFFDPESGAVLLDGVDIRRFQPSEYRRLFSMVTQEVFLFHDSVLENIRFSKPGAGIEEIERAAKNADAHDFIMALPKGYDTVVGDRGIRLSGGQRQRISIARAFLKDSPILLFDEATSHLDTESEQAISAALARLSRHKTSFVIAHRLSTVRSADHIVVIENGRVIGEGGHNALIQNNACYRELCRTQFMAAP